MFQRPNTSLRGAVACGVALLLSGAGAASPLRAQGGGAYAASSLGFGTGLVRTPVAWVSPGSGDLRVFTSATAMSRAGSGWNAGGAVESHWRGRASLGVAVHSNSPEWGLFGNVLLMEQQRDGMLPSIAIGFRNLGPYRHLDRLQVSYSGIGAGARDPLPHAAGFRTAPTLFAVATRTLPAGPVRVSGTIGYGNGLFSDDGGLARAYSSRGTIAPGLFLGAHVVVWSIGDASLSLVGENDGFDWNTGLVGSWRGISLGVYGTELEEGARAGGSESTAPFYNYSKLNVAVGYRTNVGDVLGGVAMRRTVDELERERETLRSEIARREKRIGVMEARLHTMQAGELGEVRRRREQLESRIREERDAIRRAEERLRNLESERTPHRSGDTRPNR